MKKLFVFLLIAALVFAGIIATNGSASAKDKSCRYEGIANEFVMIGDTTNYKTLQETTFELYRCTKGGNLVFKSTANTAVEYKELRAEAKSFAKVNELGTPILFCRTGKNRGFLLDMYYHYEEIKKPSKAEIAKYKTWVKKYDRAHNCNRFVR